MTGEILVIDGYNLIHAAADYGAAPASCRDVPGLVGLLEHYAAVRGLEVFFVLDGTSFKDRIPSSSCLHCLTSEPGQTADAVIERMLNQVPPSLRLNYVVVSNDRALCNMALGSGARTMPSRSLIDDLKKFIARPSIPESRSQPPKSSSSFNNPFEKL